MGADGKAGSGLGNIVVVAHPANGFGAHAFKQLGLGVHHNLGFAVFTLGGTVHLAAQLMHHQLAAVANTQNGHAPAVNFGVTGSGSGQIHAVGAAGKNNAFGVLFLDFGKIGFIRVDLTIYIALAHAAGNELIILAAKVQYDHGFLLHREFSFQMVQAVRGAQPIIEAYLR